MAAVLLRITRIRRWWPGRILLDISLVSDGGIAFILTTADRAKDCPKPPSMCSARIRRSVISCGGKNFTHMAVRPAKEQAFGQAALTLDDRLRAILRLFHRRGFVPAEDYGFCKGRRRPVRRIRRHWVGWQHRSAWRRSALLLSPRRPHWYGQAIRQIRRGRRADEDCNVVMTTGHGGTDLPACARSTPARCWGEMRAGTERHCQQ